MADTSYCQACRRPAAVKYCEFTQGIGMLVIRTQRGVRGHLCRECASKYFWQYNSLTLLTGWWGMISFVTNIVFIGQNLYYFVGSRSLASPGPGGFPVEQMGRAGVPQANLGPSAPVPVPVTLSAGAADPGSAVEMLRRDVQDRLRAGEGHGQVAAAIARSYDLSPPVAEQLVTAIASGRA